MNMVDILRKGTGDGLLPEEWGWRESEDEILVPVTTDLLPAPDDLLRIIYYLM